ncbi:MAG: HAMP domain-containing histidine kinase [Acidobacteria bacterium]|nr:HAMP domain-containing histidine kinase [Acidobacteriota bacterium]
MAAAVDGLLKSMSDRFLAMLGHELRNPLAPIVTALHVMRMRGGDIGGDERRIIERQVAHLSRLVDDVLDVSRITKGKIQPERELVNMQAVVARALDLNTTRCRSPRAPRGCAPAGRADLRLRRSRPTGPDRVQPADQRRQVHVVGKRLPTYVMLRHNHSSGPYRNRANHQ